MAETQEAAVHCERLSLGFDPPEVHPVLDHIEGALSDGVCHILLDEFRDIALHKVKTPALIANVVLQVDEPVLQGAPEALIEVVQVCMLPLQSVRCYSWNSVPRAWSTVQH